jgi:multidrug efflux system membrane fusion protein
MYRFGDTGFPFGQIEMRFFPRIPVVPTVALGALLLGVGLIVEWSLTNAAGRSAVLAEKPIPVVATQVIEREIPIYRGGLGFVEAFKKVSIASRVEGQLITVSFKEGQEVKAGDLLALIDPRPFETILHSKEAALRASKARATSAKANLDRMADLIQREVGTRQALDNQQALYSELVAQIDAAEADAQSAALQLEYTAIRSPIDGTVGLKLIDQGNLVRPGDPVIAVVTQVQPISIVFSLPQEDLAVVNKQLSAGRTMTVLAMARDSKLDLGSGTLATIDNQVDSKTGTFKLKAIFANEKKTLWPGEFVSVRLVVEDSRKSVMVPASAVQRGQDGAYVYVIDKLYKAVMRPVSVDLVQDGFAAVKSGLSVGENVIVEGQFKLRPGSAVELRDGGQPSPAVSSALERPRG